MLINYKVALQNKEIRIEYMKHQKIFFCSKCGALDYAEGSCPRCKNVGIDRADLEFLKFGTRVVSGVRLPVLLTDIRFIEKNGWN